MNKKFRFAVTSAAFALATACLIGAGIMTMTADAEGYIESYDFTTVTDMSALDMFSVGIDPQTNNDALGYTSDSWVTYEKALADIFTLTNGLKVKQEAYSGNDVSENNIYVRYNTKKMQYFTAELTYSFDDETRNGWAGFIFGYSNYTRKARWGDSPAGVEMFVQKDGKGTYSSSKLNNSEYTEDKTPEGWTEAGEHTLRITAKKSGVVLNADGTDVIAITAEKMTKKQYTLDTQNIGFYFTNAVFTAKKFSFSPLNEAGDAYQAVESIDVSADAEVEQFAPLTVQETVTPANASIRQIGYELPAGAIADGNKIYFTRPGDYTVTAYSMDNPDKKDTFTVKVNAAANYSAYKTTQAEAEKNFDNYYVTNGGSKDGTSFPIADYWNFNEDGSMTLKEKKKSGVDAGYVLLYLKDIVNGLPIETNGFEINYMVKTSSDTPNGWHGVGFALGDRATVPNQEGISVFIQEEALKATIWGSGVGGVTGPNEVNSKYTRGEWNFAKVRVYGQGESKVEMYINDMTTPVASTTATNLPVEELALFTTTTITLSDINYAPLDKNGNTIAVVYPTDVTIVNTFNDVTAGDKVQLNATIAPANVTNGDLLYSSSNALVATVNGSGMITFLNAGETTITVKCKGNPAISAEVTVSVKDKEVLPTSVSFDAQPKDAVVGGKYTLLVTVRPDNATNYDVEFSSSNTAVATVDAQGRMNYVGAGETTITVTCKADPTIKASFTLTVKGDEKDSTTSSGTTSTSGGCGSVTGATAGLAALIGAVCLPILRKKRK